MLESSSDLRRAIFCDVIPGATTPALSWSAVISGQHVWIDVLIFVVLGAVHTAANWTSPGLPNTETARAQAATNVNQIAIGGVTAVGILLPLSLVAITAFATKTAPSHGVLINTFVADCWFVLSLLLGLCVLWTGAFQAPSRNVQNLLFVRLCAGWQLFSLMIGVVRLLVAAYMLVQHPS